MSGKSAWRWAVFWVVTYGVVGEVSGWLNGGKILQACSMLLYAVALTVWLLCSGRAKDVALCRGTWKQCRICGLCIPVLLMVAWNLVFSGGEYADWMEAVMVVCAAWVEEIFFRGILLYRAGGKTVRGVMVSTVAFALLHVVNGLGNPDWLYTVMQMFCALALGLCFGAATVLSGSLLPAAIAHATVNLSGMYGSQRIAGIAAQGLWLCIAVGLGVGIWMCDQIKGMRRFSL